MLRHRCRWPWVQAAITWWVLSAATLILPGGARAAGPPVRTVPIPGSRFASPHTQLAFRGVPAGALGAIVVTGSRSGVHAGRVEGDSDGQGASFLPSVAFKPGEVVTVTTGLDLVGAASGTLQFTIAHPAGGISPLPRPSAARVKGDVMRFPSRPDLVPAAIRVVRNAPGAMPGDIFVAPQIGPVQDGPMILGQHGSLVWFKPVPGQDWVSDFRVQSYLGKPVLTWWQGNVDAGVGNGQGEIYDSHYVQIAVVRGADGLASDLHEFQLTSAGTALITAYYPVFMDASSVKNGPKRAVVLDSVVQEIDIPTGLVLFQWDSLDHVPLTESETAYPAGTQHPYDYFHVNSIQQDTDGNLVVSGRNTWAAYKIDHGTGAVLWRLGGRRSTFRIGSSAQFAFQHDIRIHPGNLVTLFDDGAGPPYVHKQSRAITLRLDPVHLTASLAGQDLHTPSLLAGFEGNDQSLANGDSMVGWGQLPYFTEFNARGQAVFDARFVDANYNYRAYRFPWSGAPFTQPAVTGAISGNRETVYASWNGATGVASWRVLAGNTPGSLQSVVTAPKRAFEGVIRLPTRRRFVAVQALDSQGHTLASSKTIAVR